MTFLAKFGSILLKVIQVALNIEPSIAQLLPAAAQPAAAAAVDRLTGLGQVVASVETMAAAIAATPNGVKLTSAQKLAAATPYVSQIIQQSELVAGKKITNEAGYVAAVQSVISGIVGVLNSIDGPKVEAPAPADPPTAG